VVKEVLTVVVVEVEVVSGAEAVVEVEISVVVVETGPRVDDQGLLAAEVVGVVAKVMETGLAKNAITAILQGASNVTDVKHPNLVVVVAAVVAAAVDIVADETGGMIGGMTDGTIAAVVTDVTTDVMIDAMTDVMTEGVVVMVIVVVVLEVEAEVEAAANAMVIGPVASVGLTILPAELSASNVMNLNNSLACEIVVKCC